jgi:GNAT superfamily N-acetyltransferase
MTRWRPMTGADLRDVERIADAVHADLPESAAVLAERLTLFPPGCWVTSGGYLIAHPARFGAPPPLDTLLGRLSPEADVLHLHDVALLPERQGQGLGGEAMRLALDVAARRRLRGVTLVAVHGTAGYWRKFGFATSVADVGTYGAAAQFMVRWNEAEGD